MSRADDDESLALLPPSDSCAPSIYNILNHILIDAGGIRAMTVVRIDDRPSRETLATPAAAGFAAIASATTSSQSPYHGSRRRSAGSRLSPGRTRRSSGAATASDGPSPSAPPPTIWCDCRSSWPRRDECAGALPVDRPLADRRGRSVGSRLSRPGRARRHRHRR